MTDTAVKDSSPDAICDILELVLFKVGNINCGLDVRCIQEINQELKATPVPRAPEYVRGIVNLRGQITTVIDLRVIFDMPQRKAGNSDQTVVVKHRDEFVGFLVDKVETIIITQPDRFELPPGNLKGVEGKFFAYVYKQSDALTAVLNVNAILAERGSQKKNPMNA